MIKSKFSERPTFQSELHAKSINSNELAIEAHEVQVYGEKTCLRIFGQVLQSVCVKVEFTDRYTKTHLLPSFFCHLK